MISPTRLNVLAREKRVTAGLMEKDYVNSWMLYAIYSGPLNHMLFKGGTALSKIYFPRTWRFSEDLDLTLTEEVDKNEFIKNLESSLKETTARAGIEFNIKSMHFTSGYIQTKIQYNAVLGHKNTTKLDISLGESLVFDPEEKVHKFEDIPRFTVAIKKIEDFFERLRETDNDFR
ncbi:MAG: nucleotidyl transferase AbiEii/AbiGii toxin family protein [Halobacteriota archaeon]